MRKRRLVDSFDVVMEASFIEKIMTYLNSGKLKPPPIDLYNGTKDLVDDMQTF